MLAKWTAVSKYDAKRRCSKRASQNVILSSANFPEHCH